MVIATLQRTAQKWSGRCSPEPNGVNHNIAFGSCFVEDLRNSPKEHNLGFDFGGLLSQFVRGGNAANATDQYQQAAQDASPDLVGRRRQRWRGRCHLGAADSGRRSGSPDNTCQASQLTPEQVQVIANRAERHSRGIIDKMSGFFAEHLGLIKTRGGAALGIALAKLAQSRPG